MKDISTKNICKLDAITLKNNIFKAGEEVYPQLLKTTIGTKFARTSAKLFMVVSGKKIFENTNFKPFLWFPYLNDIFLYVDKRFEKTAKVLSIYQQIGNKEKQRYIDKSICLLATRFSYYPVRIIKPFYYL